MCIAFIVIHVYVYWYIMVYRSDKHCERHVCLIKKEVWWERVLGQKGISFHVVINVTPTPKLVSKYVPRRELSFCAIYLPDFIRDPILPSTAVPQTSCSISQANCKAFVQILN